MLLLHFIWAESEWTPTLVTYSQYGLFDVSGSELKASIVDSMFSFFFPRLIFLSAWYFWNHCCLLICVRRNEALASCCLHCGAASAGKIKCQSASACHKRLVPLVLLACTTNTQLLRKSQWIIFLWIFLIL